MTPGRLSKLLSRQMTIAWREQPTQAEIEALDANIERVGLVIKVRWAIVAALGAFSLAGAAIYAAAGHLAAVSRHMVVPGLALALVLVYNGYFHSRYRRFGNLALFNMAQLLADIAVVSILIYYSGGVYSWFDSMYVLFVLEAALILPNRRQVWAVAAAAAFAYAAVLLLDLSGVLPHMDMPFVADQLNTIGAYVIVRAVWALTVIGGAATIGTMLMAEVRRRQDRLVAESVRDQLTGLYDREYLRSELTAEIERAKRYGRGVSVVLADVDDLERFNAMFGHEVGNEMLRHVAEALRQVRAQDPENAGLIVIARYGGEEFALLVPEAAEGGCAGGERLAEAARAAVEALRDDDRSVTLSVGVATFPADGRTPSELMGAADTALSGAAGAGGNQVRLGRDCRPGPDGVRDR